MPRIAGLLTQLCGAGCVLVGTVAAALLIDQMDGAYLAILLSWIGAGMIALVCGGLAGRPSPAALVLSAALNASFSGVLFAVASRLSVWLRILSPDDAANAATAVISIGVTAAISMLACLVSAPLALRYWRDSGPRTSRELPAAHFGPGGPGGSSGPYMYAGQSGQGGPVGGQMGMQMGGPMGAQMEMQMGAQMGAQMGTQRGRAMGPMGAQMGGEELQPSSTAPGFPPPVTGAFQLSPADSGEIVMLAGGGKPPPSAHPLRPAVAQQPRSEKTSLPQQPAPPQPQPSPYAATQSPYAPQPQPSPYAATQSPYAPQPQGAPQPSPYAATQSPYALPLPAPPRELTPPAPPVTAAPLFRAESTSSPYAPAMRSDSAPAAPFTSAPRPDSVPSSFSPTIGPRIEPQPPLRRDHTPPPMRPDSSFGPPHDEYTPPPYYTGYPAQPGAGRNLDHTPPPGSFAYAPPHRDHTPPPHYLATGIPSAVPAHLDRTPAPMMYPGFGDPAFAQPMHPGHGPGHGQQPFPPPPMVPPGYGAPSFAQPGGPGQPAHFRHDPTPPIHQVPPGYEQEPPRSRRGLWIAIAGLALGGLAGIIVMATSSGDGPEDNGKYPVTATKGPTTKGADAGPSKGPDAGAGLAQGPDAGAGPDALSPDGPARTVVPAPRSPRELLEAVHQAAGKADVAALKTLLVPTAFGFGVKATSINRTADAVAAAFAADLGPAPAEGFTVTASGTELGEDGSHAWIAEELDVSGGSERRRFAVTMLAAAIEGRWRVVAWHWAVRLPDDKIEQLVEDGDLPIPEGFDDKIEAPAEALESFRAAFSSTESYSLAVSPRGSSFNFGSAPGERLRGGDTIRRVFKRLRAEIRISEGVMITAAGSWDPAAAAAPTVAWAAANVEFATRKSRRILRVLSVLVRENDEWRLVQTQWSDGA